MKKYLMFLIIILIGIIFIACSNDNEKQDVDEYVKISFYVKGELFQEDLVIKGDKAHKIEAPAYNGYEFCGWFLDNEIEFDFSNSVDNDIKLYAKYELNAVVEIFIIGSGFANEGYPEKYEVKYNNDIFNGEIIWSIENYNNSDDCATISSDGLLTVTGTGYIYVVATLKDNPEIHAKKLVQCTDENEFVPLEDFHFYYQDYYMIVDSSIHILTSFVGEPDESGNQRRPSFTNLKWETSDSSIATVDNGVVTGISEGVVTITASSTGHEVDDITITKSIQVYVYVPKIPTKWELKTNISNEALQEGLKTNSTVRFYVETGNYDEDTQAVFTSSNPEVGVIDETGTLILLNAGTTTITATSVRDATLSSSIEVKCILSSPTPYYPDLLVSGYNKMYVGYSQKLSIYLQAYYQRYYSDGILSAPFIWKSSDEEVATVDENGVVKAIKSGTVRIKVSSSINSHYFVSFRITIEDDYEQDTYPNMGGYEIVIMDYVSQISEIDPFDEKYAKADKTYRQLAWNEVEEKYNCNIVVKPYPEEAYYGDERIKWLRDNAKKSTSQCDLAVIPSTWISRLCKQNVLINVSDYYAIDGKYLYSDFIRKACTFHKSLYGLPVELEEITNYVSYGLFYNYGMIKEYGIDDPAMLFNEGKWSYTDFEKWVKDASRVLGDKKVLSGHPYIYYYGMTNAAGINIASNKLVETNIMSLASKNAMELLSNLTKEGFVNTDITWGDGTDLKENVENSFFKGGTLMISSYTSVFEKHTLYSSGLAWENLDEVGYVPFPYPDNFMKDYTRISISSLLDIFVFLNGRNYPNNVDSKIVFDAINMMIDKTRKYMNEDELFDAETIIHNSIAKYIDNEASIEAMMFFDSNHIIFDPAHSIYNSIALTPLSDPAIDVMFEGKDFIETFAAVSVDYEKDLLSVYG